MGRSFLGTRRQVDHQDHPAGGQPGDLRRPAARLSPPASSASILAELLITPTGIGDLITYNRSIADYPKMYAAIVSIIVFSVLFIEALERIEVTLFRPEKRAST